MSSFKKILLIVHPTCYIDLHYWDINLPEVEWMKFNPKRSSFIEWILNYLYELTLTLNAGNRSHKESGQEQDSYRKRNQDFVAPASWHIPLWAVGLITPLVAPALRENAFWNCVLNSSRYSETEWENERERVRDKVGEWSKFRGRPKADQRAQWNKGRYEQANSSRIRVKMRTEHSTTSIVKKRMILLINSLNLRRRLPFRAGILQCWTTNQERPESTFEFRRKPRNRDRFNKLTCTSTRARPFCWSRVHLFCLSDSCSTMISEWFSNHLHASSFWVQTFLDLGKRLLESSTVQSRFHGTPTMQYTPVSCVAGHSFRDTRIMPYANWGSVCQSARAPALRENALWCCVLDSSRQRYRRHS